MYRQKANENIDPSEEIDIVELASCSVKSDLVEVRLSFDAETDLIYQGTFTYLEHSHIFSFNKLVYIALQFHTFQSGSPEYYSRLYSVNNLLVLRFILFQQITSSAFIQKVTTAFQILYIFFNSLKVDFKFKCANCSGY